MKVLSRTRLLAKGKCRGHYQLGDSYCPIGAFLSEYLGRKNLNIYQGDGFFDAPEEVTNVLMLLAALSPEGLKRYMTVDSLNIEFLKNWIDVMGTLLWDAEQAGLIQLED